MRTLSRVSFCASLLVLLGCSNGERANLIQSQTVEISPGLPASATNAVLHLSIRYLKDASSTDYLGHGSGNRSLQDPVGSGSMINGTNMSSQEERLVAIIPDGFQMRFTRIDNGAAQTNTVLFRFGKTTQTNAIGWEIVGKFK